IAQSAGLSTGAIYRRYASKDQLVADTIRAHLTSQRTTWAIPFVARLTGTQDGDPATVLAEQLALAGNADPEQTRLALQFLVASRVSPDARQVLVQRITDAQQARQSLFEVMQRSEIFSRPDTPLALSWALQITPTGTRLLSLVTPQPDQQQWQPVMARLIRAL
ncbi:MAG: TetR family transcriptional regulator, partial [Actinomycetales bacterium]